MWQLAVGEESRVNDPNTRTAEVLGQVLNLEPRTEQRPVSDQHYAEKENSNKSQGC